MRQTHTKKSPPKTAKNSTNRSQLRTLQVNGVAREARVRSSDVLLDTLRAELRLTGTKRGCDLGTCGCCTVLVNDQPRLSCLTLTEEVQYAKITTIEAIGTGEKDALHPVQQAFVLEGGTQCGFCTPGFVITAKALLEKNSNPTELEIREAVSGNMCRCTGYTKIVTAIKTAGKNIRENGGSRT